MYVEKESVLETAAICNNNSPLNPSVSRSAYMKTGLEVSIHYICFCKFFFLGKEHHFYLIQFAIRIHFLYFSYFTSEISSDSLGFLERHEFHWLLRPVFHSFGKKKCLYCNCVKCPFQSELIYLKNWYLFEKWCSLATILLWREVFLLVFIFF